MSDYELALVTADDLPEKDKKDLIESIEKKITDAAGNVKKVEETGKRSLAYPIKKKTSANFTFLEFSAEAKVPASIAAQLRLSEEVLRSLLIKKAAVKKVKTRAKARVKKEE